MTNLDMTIAEQSRRPATNSTQIGNGLRRWLSRLIRNRRIDIDLAKVHDLSDDILRDIGLHRGDIDFAIRNGRRPDE